MKQFKIENINSTMVSSSHKCHHNFSCLDDLIQWQIDSRNSLKEILGMEKFRPADPALQIISKTVKNDYFLYDLKMNTEPEISMSFFLLTPPDVLSFSDLNNYPVVIVPHGHGSDGRYGPAGIFRHEDMEKKQQKYNHDLGIQFVRRGFLVICPDARGSGDRRNAEDRGLEIDKLLSSSCNNLNFAFISIGTSLAAAWCWDLMSLVDLLIEKNWGDPDRIGVCGFSGGGAQALLLGALDKRVKCTGISGYFYKVEDCILTSNLCGCNFIPRFFEFFDMASLGKLIFPRSFIIEKGIDDPLNGLRGIDGPRELVEEVHRVYTMLNKDKSIFQYSEFPGVHEFNGKEIFSFFDRHLKYL
ncbi:MAG: hypothetical protein PF518_01575 [Spirochaetaceae bacterium]|nr:hypothetical protein [Spirochaetaceae bacterium]